MEIDLNKQRLIQCLEGICSETDVELKDEWKKSNEKLKDSFFIKNITTIYSALGYNFERGKSDKDQVIRTLDIICKRLESLDSRFTEHSGNIDKPRNDDYSFEREMELASSYAQHVIVSAVYTGDEASVEAVEAALGSIYQKQAFRTGALLTLGSCYTKYSGKALIEMAKLIGDIAESDESLTQLHILLIARARASTQEIDLAVVEKARGLSGDLPNLKKFVNYIGRYLVDDWSETKKLKRIRNYNQIKKDKKLQS